MTGNTTQLVVLVLVVLLPIISYLAYHWFRSGSSKGGAKPRQVAPFARRSEPTLQPRGVGPGGMGFGMDGPRLSGAGAGAGTVDVADTEDEGLVQQGNIPTEREDSPPYAAPVGDPEVAEADGSGEVATVAANERGQEDDAGFGDDEITAPEAADWQGTGDGGHAAKAPGDGSRDEFPDIDTDQLQPYYYYMVRMTVKDGMGAADIHGLAGDLRKTNHRMFQTMLGFDRQKGRWEVPRADKSYRELIWAVPLCNRSSRFDTSDSPAIVSVISDTMRRVGGSASFPSHNDIDERIEAVYRFCEYIDNNITVTLMAVSSAGGMPQRCGDILTIAETCGLEMIDGVLCRRVNGEVWFTLEASNGRRLSQTGPDRRIASVEASLDFPHVSAPLDAFEEMIEMCRKLKRVLTFEFVDAENNPIEEEQVEITRHEINERYKYMTDRGVRPGSGLARSLFS